MSWTDKVANSFLTVIEMLHDRNAIDYDDQQMLSSFHRNELAKLSNSKASTFNVDVKTKIRIIYILGKFAKNEFKRYVENASFDLIIVVMADKLTTNHQKEISKIEEASKTEDETLTNNELNMQFFTLKELAFNITHHVLVPKHELVTDEQEIQKIVEDYCLKSKHHFPIILKTDPVAKYYGAQSGSLFRITRTSPSAGEYVLYRCCV